MKRLLTKLRWLIHRRRKEAELRAELAFHLEEEAEERKASGLEEREARLAARRDLGNPRVVEEDTRGVWGWTWIERVGQDVRYAGRLLGRRPAFSATAIITLMLGMGGTTAVFSLLHALLMRNLPVERPEELVRLVERRPDGTSTEAFTQVTHEMLRGSKTMFGIFASWRLIGRSEEIEVAGEKRTAYLQLVSDNYFDVLGVRPFRGRVFHEPNLAHSASRLRSSARSTGGGSTALTCPRWAHESAEGIANSSSRELRLRDSEAQRLTFRLTSGCP
jgi:hypothetical protein